jgi:4-hydroxy-tetrahydrodipicolinate synthase
MKLDNTATGVFVIAPTPFTDTGALDLDSAARMTDAFLEAGATGITLLGVMGEAPKLDAQEASPRQGLPRCARWRTAQWRPARRG